MAEADPPPLFEERAEFFKVFTDPNRLQIITLLEHGPRSVTQIAGELGVRLPRVSQHLALMRRTGVVASQREGNTVRYRLAYPEIRIACRIIHEVVIKHLDAVGQLARNPLSHQQEQRQ